MENKLAVIFVFKFDVYFLEMFIAGKEQGLRFSCDEHLSDISIKLENDEDDLFIFQDYVMQNSLIALLDDSPEVIIGSHNVEN